MKTNDKILTELNEVIQYFIDHKDNEPKTEFCNNVDKLINLQADLANGAEQSDSNCNIPLVSKSANMRKIATITYDLENEKTTVKRHKID